MINKRYLINKKVIAAMSKFYAASFCQHHIHRPESAEKDDSRSLLLPLP
jgi:hypothetical protein